MRRSVVALLLVVAATAAAEEPGFSLRLDRFLWPPPDPRTAERLADWESPLGRTALAVAELQARLGSGPQPHPSAQAVVRVKVQRGLPLQLVTSVQLAGVQIAETSAATIRWPWDEGPATPPLSLAEQLALLLGQRLSPR